jgi:hypothetical protein
MSIAHDHQAPPTWATVRAQAQRIAELEAEIAHLRGERRLAEGGDRVAIVFAALKQAWTGRAYCAGTVARAGALLYVRNRFLPPSHIAEFCARDHSDNPRQYASVMICHLRKLMGFQSVECVRELGYRLTDTGRAHIDAILTPTTEPTR